MTKGKLVKALVLCSAVIVVLVIAIVGVTMIRHGFSARKSPSRIETFVARSARSMAVPARAKRMKNPIPNTAENLAEARAHCADHCAICHANNGGGNTTIGQNLYPKAPDMRQPRTQNMTDGNSTTQSKTAFDSPECLPGVKPGRTTKIAGSSFTSSGTFPSLRRRKNARWNE